VDDFWASTYADNFLYLDYVTKAKYIYAALYFGKPHLRRPAPTNMGVDLLDPEDSYS
jgi:hypothetical protein